MTDLWFFTTNSAKLANFRHLARDYGINVRSVHEQTFLASYTEPRLKNRVKLLQKSYESALLQWEKADIDKEGFFFFEDTSISIRALSKKGSEYPGVDVKYWMRQIEFSDLDKALKSKGNDRRVSVRSDIVLHLPPSVYLAKGRKNGFLQFTGISEGTITSTDSEVAGDLIRPWQDAKSFNKWFIPDGESEPYSALSPLDADKHDFRRKAFHGVIEFLRSLGVKVSRDEGQHEAIQFPLPVVSPAPPLFIICGPTCAGKTTLAAHLVKASGYMHFEASDFMRMVYNERLGRRSEVPISDFASAMLKNEAWTIPEKISDYILKVRNTPLVITGFRSPLEVNDFLRRYEGLGESHVVFLTASRKIRYKRSKLRRRGDGAISDDDMRHKDEEQDAMGLSDIGRLADVVKMRNIASKKDLYSKFKRVFGLDKRLATRSERYTRFDIHPLEVAIVSALGAQKNNKNFTTTEIAALINESGKRSIRTQKDNVSRYFNQRYYPFFRVHFEKGKIRYALSQTGVSLYRRLSIIKSPEVVRATPHRSEKRQLSLFPPE